MKQKFVYQLLVVFFSLILSALSCFAQSPDMILQGRLYKNGRPASGEAGQVQEIYAWKNFLFVSWMDSDGDFWLDTWNLSNPASALFVSGSYYGNLFDNIDNLLPDAQLKAPRDMRVINGRLVLWSRFVPRVFDVLNNGTLSNELLLPMGDVLNNGIQRLNWGAGYAASLRRMISDEEFLAGLQAGIPIDTLSKLLNNYALVNFENPRAPFNMGALRVIGKKYLAFETAVNAAIQGIPAVLNVQAGKLGIDLIRMEPDRLPFLNTFWLPKIPSIFTQASLNISLNDIIERVIRELRIKTLHTRLISKFEKSFKKRIDLSLDKLVRKKFSARIELSRVLAAYNIDPDERLSKALERVIETQISTALLNSARTSVVGAALTRWRQLTFALADKSLIELRSELKGIFDTEISTNGLPQYLVKHLLSPLLGNPDYLNYTLNDILNGISGSAAGQIVDGALNAFHTALPVDWLDLPNCMNVPNSSREMFDTLFVKAGPELDADELALIQILKAVRFYQGDNDFAAFLNDLDAKLKKLHENLTGDIFRILSGPLDTVIDMQKKLSDAVNSFKSSVRPLEIFSNPLGQALDYYLKKAGIDPNATVREALKAQKLYIEVYDLPASAKLSKVSDLIKVLRRLRLNKVTLKMVFTISKRVKASVSSRRAARSKGVTLDAIEASIRQPLRTLFQEMFGSISLDKTLLQAVEQYLTARIDSGIIGELSSQLLGSGLTRLKANTALPGAVGDVQLANQGDCIAKWKLAINTAITTAQTLQREDIVLALTSAQEQLNLATQKVLEYALRSVLQGFFEQIMTYSGESFNSWVAGLKQSSSQIDFSSLIPFTPEIVNAYAWQDSLAVLPRNVNAFGADPLANKSLSVLVFSTTNGELKGRLYLGEWETIDKITQFENFILIEGNQKEDSSSRQVFYLVDFVNDLQHPNLISGAAADSMAGIERFAVFNNTKSIAVQNAAGLFIIRRP